MSNKEQLQENNATLQSVYSTLSSLPTVGELQAEHEEMLAQINTHASQHAADGSDPITPASIGAASSDIITAGTTDLTAGTSALETGKLYFVYE